jgi:hypothetical protein
MKKGAIELSVNFIIVAVISIMLLGMGVMLMVKGNNAMANEWDKVKSFHASQIRDAMSRSGELVMAYPNTLTIDKSENPLVTVGINNDLGQDQQFYVIAIWPGGQPCVGDNSDIGKICLLTSGAGTPSKKIKNTEVGYQPIKIMTDKATSKKSYIINVCVFKSDPGVNDDCPPTIQMQKDELYGDMQKIIVNVK